MSVPASARKSGFLGIPERSVQRNGQMQLLVLQGKNKPVNTFEKQQHLFGSGLISAFAVRKGMVYIKCTGTHE